MIDREKLIETLNRYFSIGDSDTYCLTRDKSGFAVGTITIDDFKEFDEENIADLADWILKSKLFEVQISQEINRDNIDGAIKSLRWVANQIPDDLGESREDKMLQCIKVYCSNGANVLEKVGKVADKEIPKAVTHEATLYEACTCPRCHNIISKYEYWGNGKVRVLPEYCPYCGQHLKGDYDK